MANIALLAVCFALGIVLRQSGRLPETAPAALNGFIVHISLPAVILLYVHNLPIDASLIYPVVAPWILFGSGVLLFVMVGKVARWSPQTTGGLILSASLANTSFLGLPMIETFYGVSFLGVGILIDQLGTYLVLSTLGIVVAAMYSTAQTDGVTVAGVVRKGRQVPAAAGAGAGAGATTARRSKRARAVAGPPGLHPGAAGARLGRISAAPGRSERARPGAHTGAGVQAGRRPDPDRVRPGQVARQQRPDHG